MPQLNMQRCTTPPSCPGPSFAAYEKGSFATLLSVRHDHQRAQVEICAVGDTVVLLCKGQDVTRRFLLTEAGQFAARPQLPSTRNDLNTFLRDPFFKRNTSSSSLSRLKRWRSC